MSAFVLSLAVIALPFAIYPKQAADIPGIAGSYRSQSAHPRVFTTLSEIEDLAARINMPNSYSRRRFNQLVQQVGRDLAAPIDWDEAYSGCDLGAYTYAFSYESHDASKTDDLRGLMSTPAERSPPAGAAVVASRLALYAALLKAGADVPEDAPSPANAVSLAKRILLVWSDHGFKDTHGRYWSLPTQFCDGHGKTSDATTAGVGLAVARGVIYSVDAQDLLMYAGAITTGEASRLDSFHAAMYALIDNALDHNVAYHAWDCDHYSNHAANQLAALLATARLLNDRERFVAALSGSSTRVPVSLSWTGFFDRSIYGRDDRPNLCYPNSGAESASSRPFFQLATVEPGEIDDRYRNANPGQGIGYPMFTLQRLYDAAEVLRLAGFDAYAYHGRRGQSIERATVYYGCFLQTIGSSKIVTPNAARACPGTDQYVGKIVSGVDQNILAGAKMFPTNRTLLDAEPEAQRATLLEPFALDTIAFGRWRN